MARIARFRKVDRESGKWDTRFTSVFPLVAAGNRFPTLAAVRAVNIPGEQVMDLRVVDLTLLKM